MARQRATFFYLEHRFQGGAFELEVRYDQEMLPRGSVVVGMMDAFGVMIIRLPNEADRELAGETVRRAMNELGLPDSYQIAEGQDPECPGILYLVDRTVPYLVCGDGKWQFTWEPPTWPCLPGTVFLARQPAE